jgi:glycosyltransferase involved in cell wall biosynthesis
VLGGPSPAKPSVLLAMPHLSFGGAERWAAAIVRQLAADGHAVILAVLEKKPGEADAGRDWFAPHVRALIRNEKEAPEIFLDRLAEQGNADVLVLIGKSRAYAALPALRALRGGLHVVAFQFNAVDLSEEHRRFASYIDAVIVEGSNVAEQLEQGGFSREKIFEIPSAIHLPANPSAPFPKEKSGNCIGFIGRMDASSKDPMTFLEMAALLENRRLRFLMIGDGPEVGHVRRWIRERRGRISLEHLRHVTDEKLAGHLASLDILVVSSRKDGRPLIIQEAQAQGKPVVASRVGSIPDLLLEGEAGILCEPGNPAEFAAAVRRLLDDPELRIRLAETGQQRVLREGDLRLNFPLLKNVLFSSG